MSCLTRVLYRSAYLAVLKISKFLLTAVGHAGVQVVVDALHSDAQVSSTVRRLPYYIQYYYQKITHIK